MKIFKPLLLGAAAFAAYKLYEKLQTDPDETHLEGWQETAKHMRPIPKSAYELQDEMAPRAPMPKEPRTSAN